MKTDLQTCGGAPFACRTACYGPLEPQVWPHLRRFGIAAVEVKVPAADRLQPLRRALDDAGLDVITLHAACFLTRDDYVEQIEAQCAAIAELAAPYVLLTMRRESLPADEAYARIRRVAEALPKSVCTMLEVHADLATNAAVALETIRGVAHPRVRINYDPANIHYYNRGLDPLAELAALRPYLAGVHLKDTNGEFETRHFPAIGEGVIDWPALFALLRESDFRGPITLELEGIAGEEKSLELALQRLENSINYLRNIGAIGSPTP